MPASRYGCWTGRGPSGVDAYAALKRRQSDAASTGESSSSWCQNRDIDAVILVHRHRCGIPGGAEEAIARGVPVGGVDDLLGLTALVVDHDRAEEVDRALAHVGTDVDHA